MTSLDPVPLSGRQPRAVRSALAVLEEVVASGPGVTAKEISAALKLPSATTYRLLNMLVGEEYLVRLPDLRGFALGRRAARLAPPAVTSPPAAARAVVEHLRGLVRCCSPTSRTGAPSPVTCGGSPSTPPSAAPNSTVSCS
jgi:DNA-binding IclR family transcriptional regulator